MPRAHMKRLWRTLPAPREVGVVSQLQTVVYNPVLGKAEWITIARGDETVLDKIAHHLSQTDFQLYPTTEGGPHAIWPGETTEGKEQSPTEEALLRSLSQETGDTTVVERRTRARTR